MYNSKILAIFLQCVSKNPYTFQSTAHLKYLICKIRLYVLENFSDPIINEISVILVASNFAGKVVEFRIKKNEQECQQ